VRSERQLIERVEFDLLFRQFVGIVIDDPVWDHSSLSKNCDRLMEGKSPPNSWAWCWRILLSSEHFSVDGT
jgi:hypothetical protein